MGGRENLPSSLAAAAFEAVIGAIYLDGGLESARTFVLALLPVLPRQVVASRRIWVLR
jgi:dsRNA-specific ribonuclease